MIRKAAAFALALLLLCGQALGESLLTLPEQTVIEKAGTYRLRGSLQGGRVLIDAGKNEDITLILDGVEIASPDDPAIEIKRAGQARIILAEGSRNILRVGEGAKAALFSKADLTLEGEGALEMEAPGGHGIQGKKGLSIRGGDTRLRVSKDGMKAGGALAILGGQHVIVDSQEGLEGQSVLIAGGVLDITARDDGINASGDEDTDPRQLPDPSGRDHWIRVEGGNLTITAQGDGLDANGELVISGGDIRISGPVSGEDGALDAHGDIRVSGGSLMAFGAAREAKAALDAGQSVSLIVIKQWVNGGQEVALKTQTGESLLSFMPLQEWNSLQVSSPLVKAGDRCSLWVSGQHLLDFVMGD